MKSLVDITEDLEEMDYNQIFEQSMNAVAEFSPEKLCEFISDVAFKLEFLTEGYAEANVLNPQDVLAFKNINKALETLLFIDNWIKVNVISEADSILDTSNDEL
jgi:hypothetical protein